ncbi:ABC transporter substrate-binding protein [Cetobacterium sp.]|uniref:ABC transporter substrate-binding protein n=1 Tax=Cetobacterium sp. TaxID=2071632 RepID=UPI003EE64D90
MKKKIIWGLLVSCGIILNGCNSEKTSSKDISRTVVIGNDNDITGIIPFEVSNMPSGRLEDLLYNRLFKYDKDMNIIPVLAEGYNVINDTTIRIPLKKGIKFHNGDEMTSEDVAFGFEMWRNRKIKAHMMDSIKDVKILDKYTIELNLNYPFGPLIGNIIAGYSVVNKKEIIGNPKYKERAIGTGAYKFVEWIPGEKITVERFEDYWGEKSDVEKIIFKPIVEASNRSIGLEAGDIQLSYEIDPINKSTIQENKELEYLEIPSTRISHLVYNTQKGILANKNVRRALAFAIDRDSIIDAVLMGNGKKAESIIPPLVFGNNPDIKAIPYNVEKAKAILKEAGVLEGTKLSLMIADRGANVSIAQIIQSNLKDIGIDVVIDILEWGTYLEYSGQGKHELSLGGWSTGTGDADYASYPLLHSSAMGAPGNRSFYSNKKMDETLDKARRSMDREERKKLYYEVQDLVNEELPILPLYYGVSNLGVNKNYTNIQLSPDGRHELQNIKIVK